MKHTLTDTWRLFWAKTDRRGHLGLGDEWMHPLWAHLLDVACVAELFFDRLPSRVRARLAQHLGLAEDDAHIVLSLFIGLHDVGKAIPSFQAMHRHSRDKLEAAGLSFRDASELRHHGHASIPILLDWVDRLPESRSARPLLRALAAFTGFHHGRLDAMQRWRSNRARGNRAWHSTQLELVTAVAETWMGAHGGWPTLEGDASPPHIVFPKELIAVAGWTTLADWVGSMAEYMPRDAATYHNLQAYLPASYNAARRAIEATDLTNGAALRAERGTDGFRVCFPTIFADAPDRRPRALQQVTAEQVDLPDGPALVIVEAPTGEGKSEAAFHLAARLQARRADGGQGVYVALPTQATSNGLFPRFVQFLEVTHDGDVAQVQLVHGASGLNADLDRLLEPQDQDEDHRSSAYAARWFLPSKRGLLAAYGVGTVDQALLGGIVSRHFFLRLYGLAGKTIIFDEVHAYDTYMAALFARLLVWLRALDCDVIVLSATLPAAMRTTLLDAWERESDALPAERVEDYPAVTVAQTDAVPVVCGPFKTVQAERTERTGPTGITFSDSDECAVVEQVIDFVERGATVGVIVNLVARAQRIFRSLQQAKLGADLTLLHARFPFEERQERERLVVGSDDQPGRFGKARWQHFGARPAVLVATQVAEQSLDLDVDVLLTDLAPVDLLLQRAGRMHRHDPPDGHRRPEGFERPRLVVLCPGDTTDPLPDVAPIGGQRVEGELKREQRSVYLSLPLFKTYRLLRERGTWRLPDDYRTLIESVYGEDTDAMPEHLSKTDRARWAGAVHDRDALAHSHEVQARDARIPAPGDLAQLFGSQRAKQSAYDESDDAPARQFHPATRLGRDTVNVVCLVERDGRCTLDGEHALPSGSALDADEVRSVLRRGTRIGRAGVVRALREDAAAGTPPDVAAWWKTMVERTPALAYHYPLVFQGGRCTVGGTTVALDADLGLVYEPDIFFSEE